PDWDANALFVEASGDVDLSRARLGAFLKTDELEDITGMVALERLAGTVSGGGGVPEDFALDGTLRDGAFVLATADLRDRFRRVAATFSTDTDGVEMDMNAVSERFGDVAAAGRFLFGEVAWSGLVTCDVARVAGEFIKTAEQRRYALPLLAQYGESRLLTSILFPREGEDRMSISVRRDAEPMLAAEVVLAPSDFGLAPDSIEGKARVELAPLNEALPFDAVLLGQTTVSFDKKPGVETFLVRADLTHSSVRANEYVSKRAGDPLVATLTGAVDQGSWRAKALTIEALGERVALAFGEERLIALEIDVNLTPLSRLLPEGATAGGRVHGSFSLSPFAAALDLEQVAFAIDEELRLDSVNGSLSVDGGYFRCRNLKIRGARSDCIVNADFRGKRWEGELAGQRLDVDAVLVLVGAAQAFGGHPAGDSLEERPAEPTEGEFVVRLNELYYGGVRIDNLRAKVQADAKAIGVTGISLSPGSGNLTGAVTFSR
ncbi:MAG: hypothetical protein QGG73_12865, partial [Candidatus Hydrogenedentes bacterium]|nr:hypothetical protein [Candidatus Hydrogenedentota bacterium]